MDQAAEQPRWVTALAVGDHSDAARVALFEVASRVLRKAREKKGILVPRFVGIAESRWTEDANLELQADFLCYLLERTLELQVRAREGLLAVPYLFGMAKNFLEDRRRAVDPVGHSGFRKLHESVCNQIEAGLMRNADGTAHVDKHTRLEIPSVPFRADSGAQELCAVVLRYPDSAVLREQFSKKGRGETAALRGFWPYLKNAGIRRFVFQELLSALLPPNAIAEEDVERLLRSDQAVMDPLARALALIGAADVPPLRKALLREILDRMQDAREGEQDESSGWAVSMAAVGRSIGLPRQRMHEVMCQLRQVLGPLAEELGIDPDSAAKRPSSPS